MKILKTVLVTYSLSYLLSSCAIPQMATFYTIDKVAEIDKVFNSWIGNTELNLIKTFGTPYNSYTERNGNKTLRFNGSTVTSSSGTSYANSYYGSTNSQTYSVDFLLNSNGKIVSQTNNYPKEYKKNYFKRMETKSEAKARNKQNWANALNSI